MRTQKLMLALTVLCVWGLATAQEEAPDAAADAAPEVAEASDAGPRRLDLTYDELLGELPDLSIRDEISVDLIDLGKLRQAVEATGAQEEVRLTLEECIQIALDNNPDIAIASYDPMASEADILSTRGEFDPQLQASGMYVHATSSLSQQSVAFGGIASVEQWQTQTNVGVAGKLHTGTMYSLTWDMSKEESTFGGFIEEFQGQLNLTLTQPLLRGFGMTVNKVRIRTAENARRISEEQLKLTVLSTVAEVIRAYWDLAIAVDNYTVREESLANAERLLKVSEMRRAAGFAADIEVLQAKAGVATRQSDIVAARSQIQNAADRLKSVLDLRDEGMFSGALIVPVERPNVSPELELDPAAIEVGVAESIQRALANRPEVELARLARVNAELEEMRSRNDLMPQVDITGSYGQGGRNHKLRETLYGIRDGNDEVYTMGFQVSMPLNNRAARGQHERARITRRQQELRERQTEQDLALNVRLAARNVLTNQILVETNRQSVRLQEANVVAEEKRFRLGVTTSYQVLQVQEDLTLARTQLLQAEIAYETALVDLQLAEGTLLKNLGIEVEAAGTDGPVSFVGSLRPRWE